MGGCLQASIALFDRISVKSSRIKKVERWKCRAEARESLRRSELAIVANGRKRLIAGSVLSRFVS